MNYFQYLKMEQDGIRHLIDVASTDTEHIRFMQQDLVQVRQTVIDSSNSAILTRQAQFTNFLQNK
jgi:ketopantoate reductase